MIDKHEFALFTQLPVKINIDSRLTLSDNNSDNNIVRRISIILRLKPQEFIILFDRYKAIRVELLKISSHDIICKIIDVNYLEEIKPHITLLLPILKKEALEAVLYSAVEMGVTSIQLISTQKSIRNFTPKDYSRIDMIMIAAAEQSKQFVLPKIKSIITYSQLFIENDFSNNSKDFKIIFSQNGRSLIDSLVCIKEKKPTSFTILVGPEGGLTEQEDSQAIAAGFIYTRLTNTTLRALQAVAVSLGIIRSL